jgi:transcriptional regulator GlxA family with amidase domain
MSVQKIPDVVSFALNFTFQNVVATSTRSGFGNEFTLTAQDPRVATVIRALGEQPRLRTHELATLVGLGKERLRQLFRKEVGVSIGDFAMEVRLQAACVLLRTTNRSLKQICDDVGIPDPSNFTRHFKRRFLQTPSEYRKAQDYRFYQEITGFTKSKPLQATPFIAFTARATTD